MISALPRMLVLLCGAAGFTAAWQAAAAQSAAFTRPVRLIVAFAPGGGSDTLARYLAPRLTDFIGQPVVVDNRTGAAGNIATEIVTKAQPDGHTLLWGFSSPLVINPSLYLKLPFDIQRDLAPISLLATEQFILIANLSVPASTVKELVAYARAKPGQMSYASAGVGTPHHLAAELFKSRAGGLSIVHVPYKGGGPAAIAIMGGEAQMMFVSFAASLAHVKAKKLKALAVTGPQRSPEVPHVPTMQEEGFAGFDVRAWFGVLAPAGTPPAMIDRWNALLLKVLAIPEVRENLRKHGLDVTGSSPAQFAAHLTRERATWAQVIREAGIKPEG
ncbi:MAG: tripartite tricarboxylate transporter substrate binding protein [Burkholderiales bacterium]